MGERSKHEDELTPDYREVVVGERMLDNTQTGGVEKGFDLVIVQGGKVYFSERFQRSPEGVHSYDISTTPEKALPDLEKREKELQEEVEKLQGQLRNIDEVKNILLAQKKSPENKE